MFVPGIDNGAVKTTNLSTTNLFTQSIRVDEMYERFTELQDSVFNYENSESNL